VAGRVPIVGRAFHGPPVLEFPPGTPMAVSIPRHRFTVDDYHRMAACGILRADDRVELLDGEIHAGPQDILFLIEVSDTHLHRGDRIAPVAFPDLILSVTDILG
jgi:hypothetical protein